MKDILVFVKKDFKNNDIKNPVDTFLLFKLPIWKNRCPSLCKVSNNE